VVVETNLRQNRLLSRLGRRSARIFGGAGLRQPKNRLLCDHTAEAIQSELLLLLRPADDQKIFLSCQLNILRRKRLAGMRLAVIAERRPFLRG
jgi:hypothetical protein